MINGIIAFIVSLVIMLLIASPKLHELYIRKQHEDMIETVYQYFDRVDAEHIIHELIQQWKNNKSTS